ncbi:hypothetical protein Tco_0472379 [Tanacetum coccineum]
MVTTGSVIVTPGSIIMLTTGSVIVTPGSVIVTTGSVIVTPGSVITWLLLLITALAASWDFLDQRFAAIDGYRRRGGDEVSREGAWLGEQGVVMRIGHKEEMWLILWPRNRLEMLVSSLGMKEVHHQGA